MSSTTCTRCGGIKPAAPTTTTLRGTTERDVLDRLRRDRQPDAPPSLDDSIRSARACANESRDERDTRLRTEMMLGLSAIRPAAAGAR